MRDAVDVMARHVDGAMNDKARDIDVVVAGVEQGVAIDVDLDQARRVHLLIEHAVGIDQELIVMPRHAAGNVVRDPLGVAVHRGQAITGGEIDARFPFLGADLLADRFDDLDGGRADGRIHGAVSVERNVFCGRSFGLVVQFQHSHPFSAGTIANVGIEGPLENMILVELWI
jgi:hypothetical protein